MNKMLGYLKDYKRESVLAPLFKMLEATFDLFVPLVMADIVNVGIAAHDLHYILVRCGLLLLLAFIGLTCSLTAQYFSAKAAVGYSTALRHALFEHIQTLSFTEMDTLGTSTLITRMTSDVNQVQSGLNLFLRLFLRSPFVVIGAMVMAFTVNSRAALIFVVTIPLLSVVVFGIMAATRPLYKTVQNRLDRVLGLTRENLTGVRVVRAFDKEKSEVERFENANDLLTKMQLHVGHISALMNPLTYVLINIAIVALLYVGSIEINVGGMASGDVIALVNYMNQILVELVKLANLIVQVSKALAAVRGQIDAAREQRLIEAMLALPDQIERVLSDKERVQWYANKMASCKDVFFIGRGLDYAISLEGSLKLKEISYIHSEAYAAGELKHGTISLIEQGTLVIGVLTQNELYEKTISNMLECKSRGAYLMGMTTYGNYEIEDQVNFAVYVPKVDEHFMASLAVVPLQLLGYYVSVAKGLDVDKPRNLAKSVTVE